MMIVDAQIHIWGKGTPSAHHRQAPFSMEQALAGMDEAGVDKAILHPPMWDPDSNELSVEAAITHPDRFAIMGWLHLDKPESRSLVDTWTQHPGMKGFRFYFNEPHQKSWPTDGTMEWLWPACERLGIPVSLQASEFLPLVGQLAERFPALKLIVDHMGVPRASKGPESYRHLPQLLALAKHPNIGVKATGQAGYAWEDYPFPGLHEPLHKVFDAFGPNRMFWGTDITRMHCTWKQCVTLFTEELPWLKGNDLERVMGRAYCDWVGWKV